MRVRNTIAFVLIVASFVLLYPGLFQPLITITASFSVLGRPVELFSETRSIVQTVRNLHESGDDFVAGLIFLFGIVVPVVKGLVLIGVLFLRNVVLRYRLFAFVRSISKWAMNDVFVVAVYTGFLAGKASDNLDAVLGRGFYYFTAYCLVSLVALQIMKVPHPRNHAAPAAS
jgi:uncharacterized paraquat-inducible protein A